MFFFSSRRRHTRCLSDWSSDVCSSDLSLEAGDSADDGEHQATGRCAGITQAQDAVVGTLGSTRSANARSEERRVGKECRCRWSADKWKKNESHAEGRRERGGGACRNEG